MKDGNGFERTNNMNAIKYKLRLFSLIVLFLSAITAGADQEEKSKQATNAKPGNIIMKDRSVAPYQEELIETAFDTASKIPAYPHIKDQAKAQQDVVNLCIKLDKPHKALELAREIDNWRKGVCFADIAIWCGLNGYDEHSQQMIDLADKVRIESEDWRRDRIRVKIEQAYTLIGKTDEDGLDEQALAESERGKVARTQASICEETSFDKHVSELDAMIATGIYDVVNNSLYAYAALYERFYDDISKRKMITEKIEDSWKALPIFARIDLLMNLTGICLDRDDQQTAITFIDQAQSVLDSYELRAEHRVELQAKISTARFKAGQEQEAELEIKETFELFKNEKETIVDIYRCEALLRLAEAYKAVGNNQAAMDVYKLALKEAVVNPNARPQALDIVSLCCSMAFNELEPDKQLWIDINQIYDGLSEPW
jgi:tetratricopeptide (TPR) repeat protein